MWRHFSLVKLNCRSEIHQGLKLFYLCLWLAIFQWKTLLEEKTMIWSRAWWILTQHTWFHWNWLRLWAETVDTARPLKKKKYYIMKEDRIGEKVLVVSLSIFLFYNIWKIPQISAVYIISSGDVIVVQKSFKWDRV